MSCAKKTLLNHTLHSENIARAKKLLRNYFPRDCAKLSQSIAWNNSWGIAFGPIAQFWCCSLLSYCFAACFQQSICAMAILSLRQNISEELFLAGLRRIRVIIARNNFRGINCVIISERRVLLSWRSHGFRSVKSTPDPNTCEKVSRYTSRFYGILLQMYALPVAGSSIDIHQFVSRYASHLYRDTFAEVLGSGVVGTLPMDCSPEN